MVFLTALELFVVTLVFLFFLFQVIIPMWSGTVLFPFFRSKARQLEQQLRQARTERELAEEAKKLEELKGTSNERKTDL